MKEVFKFELFYKLLIYVIVLPVLSLLTGWFMKHIISESVIYNFDIIIKLLNIPDILGALLYALIIWFFYLYRIRYCIQDALSTTYTSIFSLDWYLFIRNIRFKSTETSFRNFSFHLFCFFVSFMAFRICIHCFSFFIHT